MWQSRKKSPIFAAKRHLYYSIEKEKTRRSGLSLTFHCFIFLSTLIFVAKITLFFIADFPITALFYAVCRHYLFQLFDVKIFNTPYVFAFRCTISQNLIYIIIFIKSVPKM